jgi:hypothetical protein
VALPRQDLWCGCTCRVSGHGLGRCHVTASAVPPCMTRQHCLPRTIAIGAVKSVIFEKINSFKFENYFKKVLEIKKILPNRPKKILPPI